MQKALIGKKIGMTQIFDANGNVVPVTVVEAGPCSVVMKKTVENDGYEAVQLGFGDVKVQRVNKPMKGHFDKAGTAPKKSLREFRLDDQSSLNVGDILKADVFAVGDHVDVVGTSKGKGTAGAIKRWNFSRLKMTHGTGPNARHAGSLGACSDPSREISSQVTSATRELLSRILTLSRSTLRTTLSLSRAASPAPRAASFSSETALRMCKKGVEFNA